MQQDPVGIPSGSHWDLINWLGFTGIIDSNQDPDYRDKNNDWDLSGCYENFGIYWDIVRIQGYTGETGIINHELGIVEYTCIYTIHT